MLLKLLKCLIIIILTVLLPVLFYLGSKYYSTIFLAVYRSSDAAIWGAMGDFIGGLLNPILALVSIFLILVTILQQNKALSQTAKQIQISFDEITKSVAAQEKQAELSEKQLNSLAAKNQADEITKVLNNLIADLDSHINEHTNCYKTITSKRTFKSQLLEMQNYNSAKFEDFLRYHRIRYNEYLETLEYSEHVLERLLALGETITHQYFNKKINKYKELKIMETDSAL